MNVPLDHLTRWRHFPWAQGNRFEGLSRGFKGRRIESGEIVTVLLIALSVLLALWLLSYATSLRERRRAYASPLRLFLSLCRAHRLRWSERWLLWRVARAQRLRDPARLFLEPERLEARNLDASSRMHGEQLGRLRARLFAESGQ